jgi:hypothetical protein
MGSDREQSQQDGGRWRMVDNWAVMNRHRCPSRCQSRCPSGVGWQGFRLVDTRNECFWEEEQRQGSVSKLINMLGSLEGLPSLSLYTGDASANIANCKVTMKINLEKGKVKHYEKERHQNTQPSWA